MKKGFAVIGAIALAVGIVLFTAGMTALGWDFTALGTTKYVTNTHEITEAFSSIALVTDTADITFVPTEGACRVVCCERENGLHRVFVENGTLTVGLEEQRAWYEHISVNIASPKITVYLPQGVYGHVGIKTDTGAVEMPKEFQFESADISLSTGRIRWSASVEEEAKLRTHTGHVQVEDISLQSLSVTVSTGKAELKNIRCETLRSKGSTGDILLENVIASGQLSVERDTGDVTLDGCDAAEIFIETDTGDITGTLLTEKVFDAHSDTGRVAVPKTGSGGSCKLNTDTGDIKITVK